MALSVFQRNIYITYSVAVLKKKSINQWYSFYFKLSPNTDIMHGYLWKVLLIQSYWIGNYKEPGFQGCSQYKYQR